MAVIAVYNPVCGNGTAKPFFDEHVLPLLSASDKAPDKVAGTESPGHAGSLIVDFMASEGGEITIILAAGDGTLHEMINALDSTSFEGSEADTLPRSIRFVLI